MGSYLGQHVARVSILATPYEAKVVAAIEYPLGHTSPGEKVVASVAQPEGKHSVSVARTML
jgi:hypothetical protein